jgi:DNA polymerase I-like protein with 3'-5' exonuclease and polymerase domains
VFLQYIVSHFLGNEKLIESAAPIAIKPVKSIIMSNKEFIRQRICIYAGKEFDPSIDEHVNDALRSKFNIHLPQRTSMEESLKATASDHEIIGLILQYRSMD